MKTQIIKSSARIPDYSRGDYNHSAIILILILFMMAQAGWAANKLPNALITATQISGQAPFTTTLDGSQSNDPDGNIIAYNWKFGDAATGVNPTETHTFISAGTYQVSLKVTDNRNASRTASVTINVTAAPPVAVNVPTGVYAVIGIAAKAPDSLLVNPDVTGVILRDLWSNIETQEGVYDWSYFDAQIERVSSAGKKVSLLINSGGQSIPEWVMNLNIETFTFTNKNSNQDNYNTAITIPLFWDPVFLEKKLAFIEAAGQRYANNPNIVLVNAQCAGATTADWNIPTSDEDITAWKALGFTSDKLLQACQQVVDATMTAFPDQTVNIAIGRVNAALDSYSNPDYVATSLLSYANSFHPGRFVAAKYNLSATTADPLVNTNLESWQVLQDYTPNTGAQMLWLASDETSCRMNGNVAPCDAYTMLDKAVNTGINYGQQYLEIYQGDIDNPELTDIIHHAAVTLGTH